MNDQEVSQRIVKLVSEKFGVPEVWITRGRARACRKYSRARAAAMHLMAEFAGLTHKEIAHALSLDRSSISYGLAQLAAYRAHEPVFDQRVGELRQHLGLSA